MNSFKFSALSNQQFFQKPNTNEGEPAIKRGRGRPRKTPNASVANAPDAAPSASVAAEFIEASTHHSLGN